MPLVLFILFIVVPIIEIAVIIQVGQVLGTLPTVVALIAVSIVGAALVRREGTRAWSAFRNTLAAGRAPTAEVVDGALVLAGGALLLTPGFVTDALGLSLVFGPTRSWYNRALRRRVRTRFFPVGGAPPRGGMRGSSSPRRDPHGDPRTIDVEVVDVQRNGSGDPR
ncbi:MAG: hypothetical protein GEU81_06875 [Nitriliruptorales bacterium]|nr:hypothetical protein [Nitriliruptorales bacterium]